MRVIRSVEVLRDRVGPDSFPVRVASDLRPHQV